MRLAANVLALLGWSVASANGSTPKLPVQPNDHFATVIAVQPQVSPDGRDVLYTRSGIDIMTDDYTDSFRVAAVDGSPERQPCEASASMQQVVSGSARWSPDSKQIAYVAGTEQGPQIHVCDLRSGTARRLSSLPGAPSRLAWSPDGKTLAFLSVVADPVPTATLKPLEPPAGAVWRGKTFVSDEVIYRHDGAGAARPQRHHLFVMPANGGEARQISQGRVSFAGYGGFELTKGFPSWSPDSREIVISGRIEPDDFSRPVHTDVFAYDVASGQRTRLTEVDGFKNNATLSPDGKLIAYVGWPNLGKAYHMPNLWVMKRDGSELRSLTPTLDKAVQYFVWAPDSRSLLTTYADAGHVALARIDLSGKVDVLARNVGAGRDQYTANNPQVSAGAGGVIAYSMQDELTPGDLVVQKNGRTRRLTNLNAAFFASRVLGRTEERWFTSTHDGQKIHGFVVTPPGFDPSRRYPSIVHIHGGPYLSWGRHYDYTTQRFAAAGYVVVFVNARGSWGYGQAFADLLQNDFPGAGDVGDYLGVLDAMAKEPWIDPNRFYVTGGSAGGLQTAWLIGHTQRFRAAAPYYMVADWTSLVLTTDNPHRTAYLWFKGPPWSNHEEYWRRSPLRVVGNVKTPTLILHGEQDWRTPLSQAEEYFTALKLAGVETRLVRFPGEPHDIDKVPSNNITLVSAIIDWFDMHGGR